MYEYARFPVNGSADEDKKANILTKVLSYIGGSVLFLMMVLTVIDVFMRYVFNSPLLGVQEITEFMLVTFVFFTLAYTETEQSHIRVDFVMDKLPLKFQDISSRVVIFIEMLTLLCIAVMGVIKGIRVRDMHHVSGILGIPVYPFYFAVVLGTLAMALELFREFIRKNRGNNNDI